MATRREVLGKLGAFAFRWIRRAFAHPDIEVSERRGRKLGDLLYRLDRKHRERSISNLALAFPDWDQAKCVETSRAMHRHFGMVIADFMRSPLRSAEELEATTVADPDSESLLDRAKLEGKGVLLITGHLGNWERVAQWFSQTHGQLAVVARDADVGDLQKQVLALREGTGIEVLSRGSAAREIIKRLRSGGTVAILPDQNAEECFVPFFAKPAGTVLGPAVLHLRTGAPLLMFFTARVGVGKYRVWTEEVIMAAEGETPEELMTRVNAAIESAIRKYPEQYLWMHDRWKSARQRGLL
ncbi:MAG: lysophospholipid acyltransferase family protein [Fimbriimonas sp.]